VLGVEVIIGASFTLASVILTEKDEVSERPSGSVAVQLTRTITPLELGAAERVSVLVMLFAVAVRFVLFVEQLQLIAESRLSTSAT